MPKIATFVIETNKIFYGPFRSMVAADAWLQEHINNIAPPIKVHPVMVPLGQEPMASVARSSNNDTLVARG